MNIEEIENSFSDLINEIYISFFKPRGFKKSGRKFTRPYNDITQVFYIDKSLRSRKTGIIIIQPQIGFYNESIANLFRPKEKDNHTPKIDNSFIASDLGLYSGTTFYNIDTNNTKRDIEKLCQVILADLERTLAPIFDVYKSLIDIEIFLTKNFKSKSLDKIYSQYENQNEFETAVKRFYQGLTSYLLYVDKKPLAVEILKEKRNEILTPKLITKGRYDENGKLITEEVMEISDFWQDLPFIERLSKLFDIKP